ncbi:hypothetical protein Tco_1318911 [Tanacetum coccineum]
MMMAMRGGGVGASVGRGVDGSGGVWVAVIVALVVSRVACFGGDAAETAGGGGGGAWRRVETKDLLLQVGAARATSTNIVNTVSTPISTASPSNVFSAGGPALNYADQDDS